MAEQIDEVENALYEHFINEWRVGTDPRTPVARENKTFKETSEAYVRISMELFRSRQETLGQAPDRKFQRWIAFYMELHVPIDTGTKERGTLQQAAVDIFEGRTVAGVIFYEVTPRNTGKIGRFTVSTVEALGYYFQRK